MVSPLHHGAEADVAGPLQCLSETFAGPPAWETTMEWEDRQESSNVDDRRGLGAGAVGGIAAGGGGLLILVLALLFGVDPSKLSDVVGHPERERPARSN